MFPVGRRNASGSTAAPCEPPSPDLPHASRWQRASADYPRWRHLPAGGTGGQDLPRAPYLFPVVPPDGRYWFYASAGDPVYGILLVDNFR